MLYYLEKPMSDHLSTDNPQLYATIFETTGAATVIIRGDTIISRANAEFCRLSGYSREEIEGQLSWTKFVAPEDLADMQRYHQARRRTDEPIPTRYEFTFIDRFERRHSISLTVDMIPQTDRSVASLIDITREKEEELRAREYSERLRALHDSAIAISDVAIDPQHVYESTLLHVAETVQCDTTSIQLLEDDRLRIVAARGFADNDRIVGLSFPIDEDFPNARVAGRQEALTWDDVTEAFPHFRAQSSQWQSGHIRSWLGIPLVAHGTTLGVIALDRATVAPFTEQDVQLVSTFAGHVATAIHNARLFDARSRYESELLAANHHKETLLQELHHRVKNNLQIISSLLRIRARSLKDADAAAALSEVEVRILAMASVHERLYEPSANGFIELGSYLEGLTRDILASHAPAHARITPMFSLEHIEASLDICVPVGLLVSELVLNVAKHAFRDGESGTLSLSLTAQDDGMQLQVSDDGRGMRDEAEETADGSIGLELVRSLAQQLNGESRLSGEGGTTWVISFPHE
jgi:PAS domain S-box-containing protein